MADGDDGKGLHDPRDARVVVACDERQVDALRQRRCDWRRRFQQMPIGVGALFVVDGAREQVASRSCLWRKSSSSTITTPATHPADASRPHFNRRFQTNRCVCLSKSRVERLNIHPGGFLQGKQLHQLCTIQVGQFQKRRAFSR